MNKVTPRTTLVDLNKVLGPKFVKQSQELQKLEQQIIKIMEKPKYFVIKMEENSSLWKEYINWLNATYDKHSAANWSGNSYNYYGFDGSVYYGGTNCHNRISDFENNPTLLTLEQWKKIFIDNTLEDYVIKALTREHGAKIIEHFKSKGIDTDFYTGSVSQEDNGYQIYYGIINGKFSNYDLQQVLNNNIKIKKLPMEKEIIGYKLIKPEYKEAAEKIVGNPVYRGEEYDYSLSSAITKLEEAGVLSLWFEPIYKEERKVYTLGINETFEIVVKNKRAYYGPEDVTLTLKEFQELFKFGQGEHKIGNYNWNLGDQVINSVGCIKKQSMVSQWVEIDLT